MPKAPHHTYVRSARPAARAAVPALSFSASRPRSTVLQRAAIDPQSLSRDDLLQLQRTIGNAAVVHLLMKAVARKADLPDEPKAQISSTQSRTSSLPAGLKAGVEALSGLAMDDVRVHYDSPKPAHVQALAYTQAPDIHIAPGHEKHLPHEAWHVVQQKQGRVPPTVQADGVAINDDVDLESEADRMGAKAVHATAVATEWPITQPRRSANVRGAAQAVPQSAGAPRDSSNFGDASPVVQRVINPDWSAVKQVTVSAKTQVGVFFVTGADGTEYVVKFEPVSGPEAFAAEFIRTMGGGEMAPEVRLVETASELAHQLAKTLLDMKTEKKASEDELKLLQKLWSFTGKSFIVMEKAPGKPMHPADAPDPFAFKNPKFIQSLGELAAFDIALANYDRVLMGLNLGNILYAPTTGRMTGIDQTAREGEMAISGREFLESIVNAILGGKEPSKWAAKIAFLIEAQYGVPVNARDLDTGFAAGLLKIQSNLSKLPGVILGGIGRAAGAAAGATAGRVLAYAQYIEPLKQQLRVLVTERERDIVTRIPTVKSDADKNKEKCFITTACVEARGLPDDCSELTALRAFRDGFMRSRRGGRAQVAEYYRIAPRIVAAINADPRREEIYAELYERLVRRSVALIETGRHHAALANYRAIVLELRRRYLRPREKPERSGSERSYRFSPSSPLGYDGQP